MSEREMVKAREAEAQLPSMYELGIRRYQELIEQARKGRVVVKGKSVPMQLARQGYAKYYLDPYFTDIAVQGWRMFIHEVGSRSGRHRHQGGLAIYVLEGKGYTVVDGVRHDWEEGDLLLLPIRPGGIEHQHFNANPHGPSRWLAMVYLHFANMLGNEIVQVENAPTWTEHA